ncbi:MAG: hypothetical protein RL346_401 [Verrucomicrobiota bacterium]|jgi:hypothetical protein
MGEQEGKDPAHVVPAGLAIVLMALGLAVGLDLFGMIRRVNEWIGAMLVKAGMSPPDRTLDPAVLWVGTCLMCLGLTLVLFHISGMWRRYLVWLLVCMITLFWLPVLWLAAYRPDIGVALVAVLWSGFCAIIYTSNHSMPADQVEENP